MLPFHIAPCGDSALSLEFPNEISEEVHAKVAAMTALIEQADLTGVAELIPTYRAIMVCYNPVLTDYALLCEKLKRIGKRLKHAEGAQKTLRITIPVLYGGKYGPDLESVAAFHGITPEEVIEIHASPVYLIYMLGFTPGFSYLGGMDRRIATPRLDNPRVRIPAGSVGIAGAQTGIYPIDSPGGWQLIGRTPLELYRPDRDPPVLLRASQQIVFQPVTEAQFHEIRREVEAETYQPKQEVV